MAVQRPATVACLLLVIALASAACPGGWSHWDVGNKCYRLTAGLFNAYGCAAACISLGVSTTDAFQPSTLACISSSAESDFVTTLTSGLAADKSAYSSYVWIGHHQSPGSVEPGGGWDTCASGERANFTNWGEGQPDDANDDGTAGLNADGFLRWPTRAQCAVLGQPCYACTYDKWYDHPCYFAYPCLCELGSPASAEYLSSVGADIEEELQQLRKGVAILYGAIIPALWLVPAFLRACFRLASSRICPTRDSSASSADASSADASEKMTMTLERLEDAEKNGKRLRLRVSSTLAQLGWMLLVLGLAQTAFMVYIIDLTPVAGASLCYLAAVPWGFAFQGLALRPTDEGAIRIACAVGFLSFFFIGLLLAWLSVSDSAFASDVRSIVIAGQALAAAASAICTVLLSTTMNMRFVCRNKEQFKAVAIRLQAIQRGKTAPHEVNKAKKAYDLEAAKNAGSKEASSAHYALEKAEEREKAANSHLEEREKAANSHLELLKELKDLTSKEQQEQAIDLCKDYLGKQHTDKDAAWKKLDEHIEASQVEPGRLKAWSALEKAKVREEAAKKHLKFLEELKKLKSEEQKEQAINLCKDYLDKTHTDKDAAWKELDEHIEASQVEPGRLKAIQSTSKQTREKAKVRKEAAEKHLEFLEKLKELTSEEQKEQAIDLCKKYLDKQHTDKDAAWKELTEHIGASQVKPGRLKAIQNTSKQTRSVSGSAAKLASKLLGLFGIDANEAFVAVETFCGRSGGEAGGEAVAIQSTLTARDITSFKDFADAYRIQVLTMMPLNLWFAFRLAFIGKVVYYRNKKSYEIMWTKPSALKLNDLKVRKLKVRDTIDHLKAAGRNESKQVLEKIDELEKEESELERMYVRELDAHAKARDLELKTDQEKGGAEKAAAAEAGDWMEFTLEYTMAPRRQLRRLWLVLRLFFSGGALFCFAIFISTVLYVPIDPSGPTPFALWILLGANLLAAALVFTRANRGRVVAWLGTLGKTDDADNKAAALAALVGSLSAAKAFKLGIDNFRKLDLDNLKVEEIAGRKAETVAGDWKTSPGWPTLELYNKTSQAKFGQVDAFISHSWSDDGVAKFNCLRYWKEEELRKAKANGEDKKDVTIWLDKACLNQRDIQASLAGLPVFISGCKQLLVLAGPTYASRLWCVIELFVFVQLGRNVKENMIVKLLNVSDTPDLQNQNKTAEDLVKFDAGKAETFDPNDRQRLLAVIEASFGTFTPFNKIIRATYPTAKLKASAVSVISGDSLTLTPTFENGMNVQITSDDGVSDPISEWKSGRSSTVKPTSTTKYTLTVESPNGIKVSTSVTIKVETVETRTSDSPSAKRKPLEKKASRKSVASTGNLSQVHPAPA